MSFSKNELISIHGLLYESADYLNEETEIDIDLDYSDYRELSIGPQYIHKSKSKHEEAVQTLSSTITNSLSEEQNSDSRKILEEKM